MSPEPHTTRDDQAGGVRERIVNAALAILREKGIQELSQVQVARRAKVRQSHLTYYFPKRHDLLEAVAVRFIDRLAGGLRDVIAKSAEREPGTMLRRLADAITEPAHMRMFTGIIVEADRNPECRVVVVRETLRFQAVLAEALGGEDAFERAGLIVAMLWGLGLYGFVFQEPRVSERVLSLLAHLAGVPSGGPSAPHE